MFQSTLNGNRHLADGRMQPALSTVSLLWQPTPHQPFACQCDISLFSGETVIGANEAENDILTACLGLGTKVVSCTFDTYSLRYYLLHFIFLFITVCIKLTPPLNKLYPRWNVTPLSLITAIFLSSSPQNRGSPLVIVGLADPGPCTNRRPEKCKENLAF